MRISAPCLAVWVLGCVLFTRGAALAQASEALETASGPVVVDARWIEGTPRRAEVDLVRGTMRVRAYEGRTVRTAAAAVGDIVALGYYHGGPEPFAGVVLVDLASGARRTVELPVAGAASPHRPAGLVIAAEPAGFAIVLQEQEADPSADVLSTFARLGLDGAWLAAPHRVGIPWGLAALAAAPAGTYELAVLFGGWGQAQAGQARICVVTLSADGTPTEHPWWASANATLTDVRLAAGAGGIDLFYRSTDDVVRHHHFASDGSWGREPAGADVARRLRAGQPFFLRGVGARIEAAAVEP
jgi:hypothetical protein